MGTVSTDRAIEAPWTIENHGAPGVFGLVSREEAQSVSVEVQFVPGAFHPGAAGGETIELVHPGDSCSFDLTTVETIKVYAGTVADPGTYPIHALVNFTVLPISLTSAPFLAGGPGSNVSPGSGSSGNPAPIPVTIVSTIGAPCVPVAPIPVIANGADATFAPAGLAALSIISDPSGLWTIGGSGGLKPPVDGVYAITYTLIGACTPQGPGVYGAFEWSLSTLTPTPAATGVLGKSAGLSLLGSSTITIVIPLTTADEIIASLSTLTDPFTTMAANWQCNVVRLA